MRIDQSAIIDQAAVIDLPAAELTMVAAELTMVAANILFLTVVVMQEPLPVLRTNVATMETPKQGTNTVNINHRILSGQRGICKIRLSRHAEVRSIKLMLTT